MIETHDDQKTMTLLKAAFDIMSPQQQQNFIEDLEESLPGRATEYIDFLQGRGPNPPIMVELPPPIPAPAKPQPVAGPLPALGPRPQPVTGPFPAVVPQPVAEPFPMMVPSPVVMPPSEEISAAAAQRMQEMETIKQLKEAFSEISQMNEQMYQEKPLELLKFPEPSMLVPETLPTLKKKRKISRFDLIAIILSIACVTIVLVLLVAFIVFG